MDPQFSKIEITVFDHHLALRHLEDPSVIRPEFDYLVGRQPYEARQAEKKTETDHYIVRPMLRATPHNHFWGNYVQILGGTVRSWDLQLPLRLVPKKFKLELRSNDPLVAVTVRPVVFLMPTGWSTHLDILLEGTFSLDDLRRLVAGIRSGKVFGGGRQPMTLSSVLRELTRRLRRDLYEDGERIHTLPWLERQFVVALLESHKSQEVGGYDALATSTRARLHAALRGEEISMEALIDREEKHEFLRTRLSGNDFGISYFDKRGGSLFVLSDSLGRERKNAKSLRCLTRNLASCYFMAEALSVFRRQPPQEGPHEELRQSARKVLQGMPRYYRNPFCEGLFRTHSRLKEFVAEA